jgi:hydroxymethylpyrimidine pyrophosphatase-like HAD family hydrolase
MRYLLLATDYDGTLAKHGQVSSGTLAALDRVLASGRKLILITGRHLPDLKSVFPHLNRFARVVAENGGLLYDPANNEEVPLSEPPPESLLALLRERGVPFDVGRSVISTWEPHQTVVVDAIRELGLDSHIIFNKGAVMVLPSGVNKGSGLVAALKSLGLSPHNVVALGDAENDHALLASCECGVAVANAVEALKQRADVVTAAENGRGVEELINQLLETDLVSYDTHLLRHSISLGTTLDSDSEEIRIGSCRNSLLIAGASASGKSTIAAGILEQLTEKHYQFCLVDPEGDYENLAGALSFGTGQERPDPNAVLNALRLPENNVVVNLLAIPVSDRPGYFSQLLPRLIELRAQTARPHWIMIDEAHHLMPKSWSPASSTLPPALGGMILITVHPEQISSAALGAVGGIITTGKSALDALSGFARAIAAETPSASKPPSQPGEALIWFPSSSSPPTLVKTIQATAERKRHRRQYAEGELSPEQSFYFIGPQAKLHLRAQNLNMFLQLAEGVDDETWMHHLRRGDYSKWFEQVIKDHELAEAASNIEQDRNQTPAESKKRIKEAVEGRYTVAM